MKTIYKFPLMSGLGHQDVFTHRDCQVLKVDEQDGQLCLWAIVDNDEPLCNDLKIKIVGTGHQFDDPHAHIHLNSVIMSDGFVWHVFKRSIP